MRVSLHTRASAREEISDGCQTFTLYILVAVYTLNEFLNVFFFFFFAFRWKPKKSIKVKFNARMGYSLPVYSNLFSAPALLRAKKKSKKKRKYIDKK